MSQKSKEDRQLAKQFERLVKVTEILRGPTGCPWDRAQTHQTIKIKTIEEAYEVAQVIEEKNDSRLVDELGDLLLQVLFHSHIAAERGAFSLSDVLEHLRRKLIRRHPHVFGSDKVQTAEQALSRWEKSKAEEKRDQGSVMDGIAWAMPSLLLAYQVQKKASAVGFDWGDSLAALDKVKEELSETEQALATPLEKEQVEGEIGDLLFAVVNVARLAGVNPEAALRQAVRKFVTRFQEMERTITESGRSLSQVSLKEMDQVWDQLKGAHNE
ncbi:MAG: nucleoside triphosphate pyrophosphohydrolase [Armatimonadetes bacterium]|nr:nucleoside triphosphate pyrophosphohydrolase [Armatimonadota bacterium]MDW8121808.1 nucleoside triphosphate pyrophosphohydrolase [Armatimonadota bacterium]